MQQLVERKDDEKARAGTPLALPTRYTLADQRLDAAQAFSDARPFHREIAEIQKHFTPWRTQTQDRNTTVDGRAEAAPLMDGVFDGTGMSSAAAFVANMQADWMPSFDNFFAAEAGPLMPGTKEDKDKINAGLQPLTDVVHALSQPTRTAALEMFSDLFAGTGALKFSAGDKRRRPIDCEAVPIMEMALSKGPKGSDIERWFWKRNYLARHLEEVWPDAPFENDLANVMRQTRNRPIEVTQYTYWDYRQRAYVCTAWTDVGNTVLTRELLRVTPWVTPRLFVVPGEAMGRGLGHLGLPNAKTIGKAREYALRAAAIQLLGIWMHRRDGVFNPETAMLAPGAFWEVAFSGGPNATISRLDSPYNFDMAQFVIGDERNELRRVTLDDELPELADRVRSPTEIAARQRRYDRNRGGNTVRLSAEMIAPIARASIDVLDRQGLIKGDLDIDDVLYAIAVKSPAALAQKAQLVERYTSYLQIIIGLFGPQAALLVAEVEKLIPEMGRWMGVEERFLRTEGGAEELKQMIAQYAAQLVAAEQAKSTQARAQTMPEPDQVQQYREQGVF